jgi:hypothetical protein
LGGAVSIEWEVARHCRNTDVDAEANPDYPVANATAFEIRPNESYLSVNCPNIFGELPDLRSRLRRILSDLKTKPNRRTIKANSWFAILSVGPIVEIECQSTGERFRVELEEEIGDTSHSGIYGQTGATSEEEVMALQTLLAACASGPAGRVRDLEPD